MPLRVGIIGLGAVGARVLAVLDRDVGGRAAVTAALTRSATHDRSVSGIEELIDASDVIVEAASHEALAEHGPSIIAAGRDLLVVSVGGLVDDRVRASMSGGAGRLAIATGAVGGLDALRAAMLSPEGDGLTSVGLTTVKPASTLDEPWMSDDLRRSIRAATEQVVAFEGSARQVAERFPRSANVAATVGLTTLGLDEVRATVIADPRTTENTHLIEARGRVGAYRFELRNAPSSENPRTSALTALSVVRWLTDRAATLPAG